MTPEQKYSISVPVEHRKEYAQFFTPESIAEFMCGWILQGKQKTRALEPAYGLGIFSRILAQNAAIPIDAYEIDRTITASAESVRPYSVTLRNEDYLKSDWEAKYDAIICNPPYLKFHDYDNAKYIPDINLHIGTKLNGFTNIYTLFLLKSIAQLQDRGRLAYIIPSEFLNSDYGVEVKRALLKSNTLQHVIVVDFTECAFDDALTTACILLCEKKKQSDRVRFSTVTNIDRLNRCFEDCIEYDTKNLDAVVKWKTYYESCNCKKYNHLVPFSKFAKVSRGIATGANDYFTFKPTKAEEYNIPQECLMRCICKAADAPRTFFTDNDFEYLVSKNKAVYLFNACLNPDNDSVVRYLKQGEQTGINKRYLTANRSPWYSIENRHPSPIWVSVFNRNGVRFIRNEANIYNLTTFHCVYPKTGIIDTDILFAYLITDTAKEIFLDNSRQYGNGLVKFEPNDLNKGMAVDLSILNTEERNCIVDIYTFIKETGNEKDGICLLNTFFERKYTSKNINISELQQKIKDVRHNTPKTTDISIKKEVRQPNLPDLFEHLPNNSIFTGQQ